MAASRPNVAIFGGTGNLGKHICNAFMAKETRKRFGNILLFSRSSTVSSEWESWKKSGDAQTLEIAEDNSALTKQLGNVEVVVNVIGSAGDKLRTRVVEAIAKAESVKVYFPSEFGVDHTVHDFSHPEWDKKKAHFKLATELLPNIKICRVFAGLFLEDSIGPWFGFDTKNDKYVSYGSSNEKVAYTSMDDVGRSVATLALMPPEQLPAQVHLAGSLVSMTEIASLMKNKTGSDIDIAEQDIKESKSKAMSSQTQDPAEYLRFLMGDGKINHSASALGFNNELVNPGQSQWKWRTMSDLADEKNGRPWADSY